MPWRSIIVIRSRVTKTCPLRPPFGIAAGNANGPQVIVKPLVVHVPAEWHRAKMSKVGLLQSPGLFRQAVVY
jgi:hypothetical protein